ncbi:MAG: transporter substrate-binding domain-containing protein [Spirochaetia bacterium]|nr:transporter substrate-binding domain-containing protein [Spirochaetia bacterium]
MRDGTIRDRIVLLLLMAVVSVLLFSPVFAVTKNPSKPMHITVISDDNYPPYIFRDNEKKLHGILVDQWELWQKKTGVAVDIKAMDWALAQKYMEDGKADVIDTIFYTPERAKKYDFSPPYCSIEVPVFFSREISGINGLNSMRGFAIAVKSGDACINVFKAGGVNILIEYPNYESIIRDAAAGKVKIFCVDKPAALYYLNKTGMRGEFRMTAPLYTGRFHRAVKKADTATLALVNEGFKKISKREYKAIDHRWMGTGMDGRNIARAAVPIAGGAAVIIALLLLWNLSLKVQVDSKTKELAESEEKFRTLAEQSLLGTLILMDGALVYMNSGMEKITGYSFEEMKSRQGFGLERLFAREDAEDIKDYMSHASMEEYGYEAKMQVKITAKDGTNKWVEIYGKVIKFTGKAAVIASMVDVTQVKLAQDMLKKTVEILRESNAELEKFAYVASHDLQEPLRTISSYAELIDSRYGHKIDPEAMEFFRFIKENARLMKNLIRDLLDYSRLNKTGVTEQVDTADTVRECLQALNGQISDKKAVIEQGELPVVTAYRSQMLQLFVNLISNAIKFTAPGVLPVVKIGAVRGSGEWVFHVSDNGIGIDKMYHDRIFDIFSRLHSSEEYEGTGIGLALCKKIVTKLGGKIWLESEMGKGTTFYFTVPDLKN